MNYHSTESNRKIISKIHDKARRQRYELVTTRPKPLKGSNTFLITNPSRIHTKPFSSTHLILHSKSPSLLLCDQKEGEGMPFMGTVKQERLKERLTRASPTQINHMERKIVTGISWNWFQKVPNSEVKQPRGRLPYTPVSSNWSSFPEGGTEEIIEG